VEVPRTTPSPDAHGTPLAAILTGANVNDVRQLAPLIDAIAPIRGLRGHPLQRPRVAFHCLSVSIVAVRTTR
jgi:hypothetical protein